MLILWFGRINVIDTHGKSCKIKKNIKKFSWIDTIRRDLIWKEVYRIIKNKKGKYDINK